MRTDIYSQPVLLTGIIKTYHWGKVGPDSIISKLVPSADEHAPLAELWFGAHPSSPSMVASTVGTKSDFSTLLEVIDGAPDQILGKKVLQQFHRLPYLFKVLSIKSALSIQAHPDLTLAASLHQRDPKNYPDANHKPEIAVALTDLNLLYGFRPLVQILQSFDRAGQIFKFLSAELGQRLLEPVTPNSEILLLQQLFREVLAWSESRREHCVRAIAESLSQADRRTWKEQVIVDLEEKFGAKDVGVCVALFMNVVKLRSGQGIFIGPNIPHAYLNGDIVECMATSDNVVRAGLTPKYKDLETLISMADYTPLSFQPIAPIAGSDGGNFQQYPTSAKEFLIESAQGTKAWLAANVGPRLLFCLEGDCEVTIDGTKSAVTCGQALLIPAQVKNFNLELKAAKVFSVRVP